jgi:TRAP-type C4-dicarboxylate transport system substrate-binding protein
MYSVFYAVVNEQTWKALDDKKKEELKKIVWDERLKQRKENEHDNQSRIADLKKMKDMKVYTPTADELAKFKTATATVYEEFKSRYSNDVQKMVTEFRSK